LCVEDRRLITASSGGSLSKNKTEGEVRKLIDDVAEATQHVRVRSNPLKGVVEPSPSEASLTKTLGDMTTILTQIQKDQKEYYSIQAPPQVAQLEGPPRICGQNNYSHGSNQNQGWRDNAQGSNQNQRWNNSSSHYNNNQSSSQYHHNNNNHQANQNHHNQNQNDYTKYQAPHHRQQSNQSSSSSTNQFDELRATMEKGDESYKAQFDTM
ncbi:hypothetical protein S245_001595, partial [Arachis hypogaea]